MSLTSLAVIALVLCGAVTIISGDWRLRVVTLGFQYVAVSVLMAVEIIPALGFVRLVAGTVTATILLQSFKRSLRRSGQAPPEKPGLTASPGLFLRVAVVLLSVITSFGLAQSYPMPNFPRDITISAYWLVFSSISSLVLSLEVTRAGFALLMLELAASLVAGVMVETANLARFLLASLSSIVLALAIGYLIGLEQHVALSEEVEP
ncbi:MAG: hypothetical protein HYX94_04565 [Chloroflexi bacterium]|nr:hypothetical protein [Chloroflexota bacterium]